MVAQSFVLKIEASEGATDHTSEAVGYDIQDKEEVNRLDARSQISSSRVLLIFSLLRVLGSSDSYQCSENRVFTEVEY